MSFTVLDAIGEARAMHPQFDPRQTTDSVLLKEMDNFQYNLLDQILERDPDAYTAEQNTVLPLAIFDDGIALPSRHVDKGAEAKVGASEERLTVFIVPWRNRFAPGTGPPAYINGDTLFLFGREEDWSWADQLRFFYVPEPAPLTAKADIVTLFPDRARQVFAAKGALVMAVRGSLDPQRQIPTNYFIAQFEDRLQKFLASYTRRHKAKTFYVREAW